MDGKSKTLAYKATCTKTTPIVEDANNENILVSSNCLFNSSAKCDNGETIENARDPLYGKCLTCNEGYGLTLDNDCTECTPGHYNDAKNNDGSCKECPIGKYQNESRGETCRDCNVGKYQNETARNDCKTCANGHFAAIKNPRAACFECPMGKYYLSSIATLECANCDKGHYQDQTGQTECKKCNKGEFQDDIPFLRRKKS